MSFKFPCPHCGQRIGATLADVGSLGGCPSCQRQFVVPAPPETTPVETTPADVAPVPLEPEVPVVTHRGVAILALILSILPVLNLVALGLAIYAVVRSERPGRRGERGLAIAAVVVTSVLLIPINVAGFVGGYTVLYLKPMPVISAKNVLRQTSSPSPASGQVHEVKH